MTSYLTLTGGVDITLDGDETVVERVRKRC